MNDQIDYQMEQNNQIIKHKKLKKEQKKEQKKQIKIIKKQIKPKKELTIEQIEQKKQIKEQKKQMKEQKKEVKKEQMKEQIEQINELLQSIIVDNEVNDKTKEFLVSIKNPVFIENTYDLEKKLVVNSIYLNKITKIGRSMSTMVWQFYRHRSKLNVNNIIKQYNRDNLTINYKIFQ